MRKGQFYNNTLPIQSVSHRLFFMAGLNYEREKERERVKIAERFLLLLRFFLVSKNTKFSSAYFLMSAFFHFSRSRINN